MAVWREEGSAKHSGYDHEECKRRRIRLLGDYLKPAADLIGISRSALRKIEDGGPCRKINFIKYCNAIRSNPSEFDLIDDRPSPGAAILSPDSINFRPAQPPKDMESSNHYRSNLGIILCKFRLQYLPKDANEQTIFISGIKLRCDDLTKYGFPVDGLSATTWASLSARPTQDGNGPGMWLAECAPPWDHSVNADRPIELSRDTHLKEAELTFRASWNDNIITWGDFIALFETNEERTLDDDLYFTIEARTHGADGVSRRTLKRTIRVRKYCLFHMIRYKYRGTDKIIRYLQPRCAHDKNEPCTGSFPYCLPGQRRKCIGFG